MAPSSPRRTARLRDLVASPTMQALLRDAGTALPDDVEAWLTRLELLEGVPFNNLVADARMMPSELVRFFYIDRNWIDALRDGALSVAHLDEAQGAVVRALRKSVAQRAEACARVERSRRRAVRRRRAPPPVPLARDGDPKLLWTGLLLRSAAVANWPGISVTAYGSSTSADPLSLLRMERVSPSVLIALFEGIGERFEIAEPPQALHFGFQDGTVPRTYRIGLRGLGGAIRVGCPIDAFVDVPLRPDPAGRRVVDVRALHGKITEEIAAAYQKLHAPSPPVNPGAFALELVSGTIRQPFRREPFGAAQPPRPVPTAPEAPRTLKVLNEELRRGR